MPAARMTNPAVAVPDAMAALLGLSATIEAVGLDPELLELAHLRASLLNECSVCVDMAATSLGKLGVAPAKVAAVGAWRDSPHFTDPERAVLRVAEQLTRLSDGTGGVSDDAHADLAAHFEEPQVAAILLHVGLVNLWNRINDATRQVPGSW